MNLDVRALNVWRKVLVTGVRSKGPDLSARQMALMLTVYLEEGPHTVRGLASYLNISKPAISRALDRLGELDFVKRRRDEKDKRNVLVQRTVKGSAFLVEFVQSIQEANRTADDSLKPSIFLELAEMAKEDEAADGEAQAA
ncbi:MAG: MarR family transcriptional regulator [Alphaproteobacteria bacterium]|nr:MarR family transcriptional regulator [Alphaproteobacteria bacterium]